MTKATQPGAPIALQAATRPAVFFLLTVFAASPMSVAHGEPSEGDIDSEQTIRPLLVARCGDCHGADARLQQEQGSSDPRTMTNFIPSRSAYSSIRVILRCSTA